MSIWTPFSASVAVAVAAITVVGAEPSSVSALAFAVTPVSSVEALIAAAMAMALPAFRLDSALASEKVSSEAVAPRIATPLILRSPELSATADADEVATARASLLTDEMPRANVPSFSPDRAMRPAAVDEMTTGLPFCDTRL